MQCMGMAHAAPDGLSVAFLNLAVSTAQIQACVDKLAHLGFKSVRTFFSTSPETDWHVLRKEVTDKIGICNFRIYTVVELVSSRIDPDAVQYLMSVLYTIPGLHWKGYSDIVEIWERRYAAVYFDPAGPKKRVRI